MKRLVILFFALGAAAGHATPREHAKCDVVAQIRQPENSQGFRMSEDCSTAYVLPPLNGKIKVGPIAMPDTRQSCGGILAEVEALSAQAASLSAVHKERAGLVAAINSDRVACSGAIAQEKAGNELVDKAGADIEKLEAELTAKKQVKAECDGGGENPACDSVDDRIDRIQDRLEKLRERQAALRERAEAYADRVSSCIARHPHAKSDNSEDIATMEALNGKIARLSEKVTAERKRLSAIPGADASLVFTSGHTNLVNQFNELNRGVKVGFVAMPVKGAKIYFDLIRDGKAAGLSTVSRFKIYGERSVKEGEAVPEGSDLDGAQDADRMFGGAAGAQISLNLYAACRLRQKYADLSSKQARSEVAELIRPTVGFTYELQASKSISVHYNESYLYQLIKQNSSSGGLFWSSSSQSITEKTVADNWLKIEVSSEDTDLDWVDPEKRLFDLRREVLDAALARVTKKTYVDPASAQADGGTPPPNGAQVAAKGLRQYPNVYCQVAALALDIGNALFGGSSSSGSVTKTVKTTDIQNLIINGMVRFGGSQSFEAAGE